MSKIQKPQLFASQKHPGENAGNTSRTEKMPRPRAMEGCAAVVAVFLVLIAGAPATLPPESARVALIVAENPDLEAALTASLQKIGNFEMLERSALPAIAREAAMTGSPLNFEGADFLLVAEGQPEGGFTARLSDARSGSVLKNCRTPDGMDPVLAANWISLRIRPFVTVVKPDQKFSLLGLRFETDSKSRRQIERSLNLSLAIALQESPKTVVLERWKLNDLLFEKELLGAAENSFWNTAHLIDGSISENGGTLKIQVRERADGEERVFEMEGHADDLPTLARRIADQLVRIVPRKDISHEAEAEAYVEEANWLFRHGLKAEAGQAAETAIALGDARQSTEILRLRAFAEAAYPESLDPKLVQMADSTYETSTVPAENLPRSIVLATFTADLSADYARKYAAMPREKNRKYEHPTVLCVRTMPFTLSVLHSAYMAGYWKDNRAAIDDLRYAIKRQIEAIHALPLRHEKEWLDAVGTFYRHLIFFAPLWNDTPEETLRFMEYVLSPDFENECPGGLFIARRSLKNYGFFPPAIPTPIASKTILKDTRTALCPRLIDWGDPDNTRAEKLWRDYVESKLLSQDVLEQADGLALLWTSQAFDAEVTAIAPRYVDFFEKHSAELKGPRGQAIWFQIRRPIMSECQWIGSNENRLRTLAVFEKLLNGQNHLAKGVVESISMTLPSESPGRIKVAEARRLLTALDSYEKMLGSNATKSDAYEIRSARNSTFRSFPELANKPRPDALPVTCAWIVARHAQDSPAGTGNFDEDSGIWHDGRLWFLDSHDRKIWKIDPASFETSVLAPEVRPSASQDEKGRGGGPNISRRNKRPLIANGKLFLPEHGSVWIYDMVGDSWKPMDLPDAHYSLWQVGDKIFASFGERSDTLETRRGEGVGAYEINPLAETATLIFNSRRRPARHPLDGIENGLPFCMLPSANGNPLIGFLTPLTFRHLSDGSPETLMDSKLLKNIISHEGETVFCHTIYNGVWTLRGVQRVTAKGSLETLLWNPASDIPQPGEPVWKFPATIPETNQIPNQIDYRVTMFGDDMVLLLYHYGTTPWGASDAELYLFRRGEEEAKRIPLAFSLSEEDKKLLKVAHYGSESFTYPHIDHYGLISTDAGLAITGRAMPGFWFVPWSEIEAYAKDAQ